MNNLYFPFLVFHVILVYYKIRIYDNCIGFFRLPCLIGISLLTSPKANPWSFPWTKTWISHNLPHQLRVVPCSLQKSNAILELFLSHSIELILQKIHLKYIQEFHSYSPPLPPPSSSHGNHCNILLTGFQLEFWPLVSSQAATVICLKLTSCFSSAQYFYCIPFSLI